MLALGGLDIVQPVWGIWSRITIHISEARGKPWRPRKIKQPTRKK
jgi:hypothetical protein